MRFFFYGTLMSGFHNNAILTQLPGSEKLFDATVKGYKLQRMGSIPIAVKSGDPDERTYGEVWEVNNPYAVAALHEMEVNAGYKAVRTDVHDMDGCHDNGIYMYVLDDEHYRLGDMAEPVRDNNYREWRKTWKPSTNRRRSSSSSPLPS